MDHHQEIIVHADIEDVLAMIAEVFHIVDAERDKQCKAS